MPGPPTCRAAAAATWHGAGRRGRARRPSCRSVASPVRCRRSSSIAPELTPLESKLLGDLFAIVSEHADESIVEIDRERVTDAFLFACEHHADQRRSRARTSSSTRSASRGSAPGMRLDTETLCAALLHDTVEDTSASLSEVRDRFGDEVGSLVDGVTKLTGITFSSRDEAQAENYRKMIVAMASDVRVILIKLADRLDNMRTLGALPQDQADREGEGDARDLRADRPPAGHPRDQVGARGSRLRDAPPAQVPGDQGARRPAARRPRALRHGRRRVPRGVSSRRSASRALISGRAKHFYSIYSKMTRKGREFNEIYDLTAMRVIVETVKDTYGAVGVIHSLWKPLPGRFKDFIAMPKFNMYQSLHTTVIGPEGRPLEIQIRTREMHNMAEYGVAAHWMYKQAQHTGKGRRLAGRGHAEAAVAAVDRRLAERDVGSQGVHGDAEGRPLRG